MSIRNYQKVRTLGKGSYGDVYLTRHIKEKKYYALKMINMEGITTPEKRTCEKEIALMKSLSHPNIIGYKESFLTKDGSYLCICMTYCDGSDLSAIYKRAKKLNKTIKESVILNYFVQMLLGIEYLHEHKILHRDIKSQNMFLLGNGRLVVGDLGISKSLDGTYAMAQTALGTPYYMAPEVFENKPYDFKVDVWGCGCILYELIALHHPFEANSLAALSRIVTVGKFQPISSKYSKELSVLIGQLLAVDPTKRPSLSEVLKSDFIKPRVLDYLVDLATRPADFSGDGTIRIQHAILGAVKDMYSDDNNDMIISLKTQLSHLGMLDELDKRLESQSVLPGPLPKPGEKIPKNVIDKKKNELSFAKEKTNIIKQALVRVKEDKETRDKITKSQPESKLKQIQQKSMKKNIRPASSRLAEPVSIPSTQLPNLGIDKAKSSMKYVSNSDRSSSNSPPFKSEQMKDNNNNNDWVIGMAPCIIDSIENDELEQKEKKLKEELQRTKEKCEQLKEEIGIEEEDTTSDDDEDEELMLLDSQEGTQIVHERDNNVNISNCSGISGISGNGSGSRGGDRLSMGIKRGKTISEDEDDESDGDNDGDDEEEMREREREKEKEKEKERKRMSVKSNNNSIGSNNSKRNSVKSVKSIITHSRSSSRNDEEMINNNNNNNNNNSVSGKRKSRRMSVKSSSSKRNSISSNISFNNIINNNNEEEEYEEDKRLSVKSKSSRSISSIRKSSNKSNNNNNSTPKKERISKVNNSNNNSNNNISNSKKNSLKKQSYETEIVTDEEINCNNNNNNICDINYSDDNNNNNVDVEDTASVDSYSSLPPIPPQSPSYYPPRKPITPSKLRIEQQQQEKPKKYESLHNDYEGDSDDTDDDEEDEEEDAVMDNNNNQDEDINDDGYDDYGDNNNNNYSNINTPQSYRSYSRDEEVGINYDRTVIRQRKNDRHLYPVEIPRNLTVEYSDSQDEYTGNNNSSYVSPQSYTDDYQQYYSQQQQSQQQQQDYIQNYGNEYDYQQTEYINPTEAEDSSILSARLEEYLGGDVYQVAYEYIKDKSQSGIVPSCDDPVVKNELTNIFGTDDNEYINYYIQQFSSLLLCEGDESLL